MLNFPCDFTCDTGLLGLALDCLQSDSKARPSSTDIVERIEAIWVKNGLNEEVGPLSVTPPHAE